MQLSEHYRSYELPWEIDPEDQRRLRRLLTGGLVAVLLLGLVLPLVHLPPILEAPQAVPDRLARLMVQEQPKRPRQRPWPSRSLKPNRCLRPSRSTIRRRHCTRRKTPVF